MQEDPQAERPPRSSVEFVDEQLAEPFAQLVVAVTHSPGQLVYASPLAVRFDDPESEPG
jgi:hypothetical protein